MERGCFWFCSAPNFWSGGPTPSCWGFPLVLQYPLFTGLIFHQLGGSQTDSSHWYTAERWKHEHKQCFPRRGKKLKFHISWVVKPTGSVQTSHKISPRLNWKRIKPKTSRGIPLTLGKHAKSKITVYSVGWWRWDYSCLHLGLEIFFEDAKCSVVLASLSEISRQIINYLHFSQHWPTTE